MIEGLYMEFIIDENNEILAEVYKQNNFKIEVTNPNNKKCIVFFSGNGLYYPNTYETFEDVII